MKTSFGTGLLALSFLVSPAAFAENTDNNSVNEETKVEVGLEMNQTTDSVASDPIDLGSEVSETSWLDKIKSYFSNEEENS